MPALANPLDCTDDELDGRIKELREEYTKGFSEGRRSGDWQSDPGLKSILEEVNILDNAVTFRAMEEERAQRRKRSAALAGAGTRSASASFIEKVINDPKLAAYLEGHNPGGIPSTGDTNFIMRERETETSGYRSGVPEEGHVIGGHTFERLCFEAEIDGEEGNRARHFLRHGGESGYRVSAGAEEWAAGGPPTYDSTGSGTLLPVGQPIPPVPRRARLWLRDLMPSMTTTLAQVPYVQELNPATFEGASGATGGAATVAEAGTKPASQLSFQGQSAKPTVVAATLVISKQLFEDAPSVVQYVNGRLPYLTKYQEDYQFLQGNGSWPNLPGILNQAGLQQQAFTSLAGAQDRAQTIGLAMAKVEDNDGSPNAAVFYPDDAWKMFITRAAGGAGTFDAGTPFSALPLTVWGVQTYRSRAYPQGISLVGDFQLGGMVIDREQVNVQLYRERYAEQNLVLLICEERVGVMWFRPDLFVRTALA